MRSGRRGDEKRRIQLALLQALRRLRPGYRLQLRVVGADAVVREQAGRQGMRAGTFGPDAHAQALQGTQVAQREVFEYQLYEVARPVTIGNNEKTSGTLSVRTLDGTIKQGISQDVFINTATAAIRERRLDMDMFKE